MEYIGKEQAIERLKEAVVVQAAKDYRSALKHNNKYTIAECELFFLSEYFNVFTTLEGQALMERIQREVRNDR